ncbi:MAG: response regulator [Candidatus Omnitrophota bacterium]
MSRMKLMIIDDEKVILDSFQRGLNGEGYEIIKAFNSKDALNKIKMQPDIKIVVSDIKMPGIDGMDFLKIIKREYPYIIRIVLTGYADVDNAIAAVNQAQVYRFITKPWDVTELRIVLRLALQYQQALEEYRLPVTDVQEAIGHIENLEKKFPGISTVSKDKDGRITI